MTNTIVNIHIEQCSFKFSAHSYVLSYFNEKKQQSLKHTYLKYIHLYVHTHVHTQRVHTHTHTHTHMCTHAHARTHANTHTLIYTYTLHPSTNNRHEHLAK